MTLFELDKKIKASNLLKDRFIVPPFTVLDTKQGYWQERKQKWTSLGIKSELGRDSDDLSHTTKNGRKQPQMAFTRQGGFDDAKQAEKFGRKAQAQTSIFDPVLCEIAYRWFSRDNDTILDPFAGGSVRGILAGSLNRKYIGIDLSEKQIEANKQQYIDISNNVDGIIQPLWVCDNSMNVKNIVKDKVNFIFSCPPYYNLEVYSTKEDDLSYKETYQDFLKDYRQIIQNSCDLLEDNSFAVFVVSNFRDNKGIYYDFVGDTIKAFQDAGLYLYNECIVVKAIGTLPVRVPIQFNATRKMGKQHENFLVFYKGNPNTIKDKFGSFEVVSND